MIACYVLTTNGNDVIADMNLISVWSLQQSNRDAYVVLLCDRESAEALQRTEHPLRTAVDEVLAIETPAGSPGFRNRFVVAASWAWSYLTYQRGARLITEGSAPTNGDAH